MATSSHNDGTGVPVPSPSLPRKVTPRESACLLLVERRTLPPHRQAVAPGMPAACAAPPAARVVAARQCLSQREGGPEAALSIPSPTRGSGDGAVNPEVSGFNVLRMWLLAEGERLDKKPRTLVEQTQDA